MYCHNCGAENANEAKFCKQCGASLIQLKVEKEVPVHRKRKPIKLLVGIGAAVAVFCIIAIAFLFFNKSEAKKDNQSLDNISLGDKYMESLEYDKAIASYKEAISIEPNQIEAYEKLAEAYISIEDYEEAGNTYEKAITYIEKEYAKNNTLPTGSEDYYKVVIDYYYDQDDDGRVEDLISSAEKMDFSEEKKEEFVNKKSERRYKAYNDLLKAYEQEFGTGEMVKDGDLWKFSGLCFAKLTDFNNDGEEELILAYGNVDYDAYLNTGCAVEVWDYYDGSLQYIYSGQPYLSDGGTGEIEFSEEQEENALITGFVDDVSSNYIWTYNKDAFEPTVTIKQSIDINSQKYYQINENIVEEAKYRAELDKWLEGVIYYRTYKDEAGDEEALAELATTKQTLESTLSNTSKQKSITIPYFSTRQNLRDVYSAYADTVELYQKENQETLNVNYSVKDLNYDGIPELLIGFEYQETGLDVKEVYTYREGAAEKLIKDSETPIYKYIICEFGMLYTYYDINYQDGNSTTQGTTYWLSPGSNEAREIEGIPTGDECIDILGKYMEAYHIDVSEATTENLSRLRNSGSKSASQEENSELEMSKEEYYAHLAEVERKSDDLADSQTGVTVEMNQAMSQIYQWWDDELNYIYQVLKSTMTDSEFQELKEEELEWIDYRDEYAEKAGKEFEGGTAQGYVMTGAKAEATKERVYELAARVYD
ncbi:MAG: lysozyme inhibitor LprI family protein [Lachnospiraceae bacterium]